MKRKDGEKDGAKMHWNLKYIGTTTLWGRYYYLYCTVKETGSESATVMHSTENGI